MKTKIVYTLVSSEDDIYFEQLLVSVFSLRFYNPEAYIIVLVDDKTMNTFTGYRKILYDFVNEIKVIYTPQNYSSKERSREIKTSMRKYINGDFIFLDTDTVICDSINEIDKFEDNILIVPDFHVPFAEYPFRNYIIKMMRKIFDIDVNDIEEYYNSGIMIVKDKKIFYDFFETWNSNWRYSAFKKGYSQDQLALMKTNYDYNNIIHNLSGIYNCQITASIKYLYEGKILHFFNSTFFKDSIYTPFLSKQFYLNIKENKCVITDEIKSCILNCKSSFYSYTTPVGHDEFIFLTSLFGKRVYSHFMKRKFVYKIINFFLKIVDRL